MRQLSIDTWASIGDRCQLRYSVDGSDLARIVIHEQDQSVELIFNAVGLRSLAEISGKAAAEMNDLFEQENAERESTQVHIYGTSES